MVKSNKTVKYTGYVHQNIPIEVDMLVMLNNDSTPSSIAPENVRYAIINTIIVESNLNLKLHILSVSSSIKNFILILYFLASKDGITKNAARQQAIAQIVLAEDLGKREAISYKTKNTGIPRIIDAMPLNLLDSCHSLFISVVFIVVYSFSVFVCTIVSHKVLRCSKIFSIFCLKSHYFSLKLSNNKGV